MKKNTLYLSVLLEWVPASLATFLVTRHLWRRFQLYKLQQPRMGHNNPPLCCKNLLSLLKSSLVFWSTITSKSKQSKSSCENYCSSTNFNLHSYLWSGHSAPLGSLQSSFYWHLKLVGGKFSETTPNICKFIDGFSSVQHIFLPNSFCNVREAII